MEILEENFRYWRIEGYKEGVQVITGTRGYGEEVYSVKGDTVEEALENLRSEFKPQPVQELEESDYFRIYDWEKKKLADGNEVVVESEEGYTLEQPLETDEWRFIGHERGYRGREIYHFKKT